MGITTLSFPPFPFCPTGAIVQLIDAIACPITPPSFAITGLLV
ncbi:hypothetical protein [Coleofasciculus sp. LEGE 07081]|nr:hypothetical protein [Coleofasciculus sp. LEGE 07081]